MAKLQQYTGDENIKVLNRKVGGKDHYYSYAHEDLVSFLDGLKSVGDGKWDVGNMSQRGGDKLKGKYSKGHQDGKDVDIGIPLVNGKSSMVKTKIELANPYRHGPSAFTDIGTGELEDILSSGVDVKKLKEFFEYAAKFANVILVDQGIIDASEYKGRKVIHWDNHKDHIHANHDQTYIVPNIGFQLKLWDFDFACIPNIIDNNKVNSNWTNKINVKPEQNRYYDIHYFINTLTKKGFFPQIKDPSVVTQKIVDFVKRIVPDNLSSGTILLTKSTIFCEKNSSR